MPSWPVHLRVAKEVNKIFNFDEDLFYYGNILPDVGSDFGIDRDKVHYYGIPFDFCIKEEAIDIKRFLADYRDFLNNSLVLGYYAHLLTDNYFNYILYKKCFVQDENHNIIGIRLRNGRIHKIPIDDPKREKRKYKHHDFELFGKYIYDENAVPKNKQIIYDNIKYIKNGFLTKDIVDNRFAYFNDKYIRDSKLGILDRIFKYRYKLFTKNEIDSIFKDCCNMVIDEIKKIL